MGATLLRTALKDTSDGACPGQASASAGTSAGTPLTWAAPVQPGILEMVVGFSFGPNNEIHSRIVLGEKNIFGKRVVPQIGQWERVTLGAFNFPRSLLKKKRNI